MREREPQANDLPPEMREIFENHGYGCFAAETKYGVVHICHASGKDIEGFRGKPIFYQWQLIKMPTAPLIRLQFLIIDQPQNPYPFDSFLNSANEEHSNILSILANQEHLHLAFYDDEFKFHSAISVLHGEQQWQQLDELVGEADRYWDTILPSARDFNRAKMEFIRDDA